MSVGVLVPVHNEARNVGQIVDRLARMTFVDWILFVDDSSVDGTSEMLFELQRRVANLHVYRRTDRRGLGTALKEGLAFGVDWLQSDRIVQMDADFSHDPDTIAKLISSSADLVLGSRYVRDGRIMNWPLSRKLVSRLANEVARLVLSLQARDLTTGFRVYSRSLARLIAQLARGEGYEFQVEGVYIADRLGFAIKEVPISFTDRDEGVSKLSVPREIYRFLRFVMLAFISKNRGWSA